MASIWHSKFGIRNLKQKGNGAGLTAEGTEVTENQQHAYSKGHLHLSSVFSVPL